MKDRYTNKHNNKHNNNYITTLLLLLLLIGTPLITIANDRNIETGTELNIIDNAMSIGLYGIGANGIYLSTGLSIINKSFEEYTETDKTAHWYYINYNTYKYTEESNISLYGGIGYYTTSNIGFSVKLHFTASSTEYINVFDSGYSFEAAEPEFDIDVYTTYAVIFPLGDVAKASINFGGIGKLSDNGVGVGLYIPFNKK